MNAPVFRPLADRLPNGRIAVYVGATYSQLAGAEALQMFVQLADAMDLEIPAQIRFRHWLSGYRVEPAISAVRNHFNVSRATAHRWLAAARAARSRSTP